MSDTDAAEAPEAPQYPGSTPDEVYAWLMNGPGVLLGQAGSELIANGIDVAMVLTDDEGVEERTSLLGLLLELGVYLFLAPAEQAEKLAELKELF